MGLAVALVVLVATWPRAHPWRIGEHAPPGSRRNAAAERSRRSPSHRSGVHPMAGELSACAELIAVAVTAGCGIHQAVIEVGESDGPGRALAGAAAELRRGGSLLGVLDDLPGLLGAPWQALCTTLSLGATAGSDVVEPLRRLAANERLRARRRIEQRVRRLPVVLLLPLTTMVLPAFVLVTLVPVALVGSATLRLE